MKNKIIVLVTFFSSITLLSAQDIVFTSDYNFLGYTDDVPVFSLFEQSSKIDKDALYTLDKKSNLYGFKKMPIDITNASNIFFIHNKILIRGDWDENKDGYKVSIFYADNLIHELFMSYSPKMVYNKKNNVLIFFVANEPRKEQVISFNFNELNPKPVYLPLKGYRGYTVDDWLYFAYYHENYGYSPYPDDIFRVKIGDWYNPELVFTSDEYDDWFLYPESHVIATDIDLNERSANRDNQILYNVEKEAYAVISNIKTNRSPAPAYLRYEGEYYAYYNIRNNTRGLKTIGLELLPPLPETYPNKGRNKVLPREVWYNVPLHKKTFKGSFITPYFLREASKNELAKLDKSQLRLLRNAIYAQYSFVFSSSDLQKFYGKFEWYRMMTAKKEDNEDVVLLPDDKKRADLIREVEKSKK